MSEPKRPDWWPHQPVEGDLTLSTIRQIRGYTAEWEAGAEAGIKAVIEHIQQEVIQYSLSDGLYTITETDWINLRRECGLEKE